MALIYIVEDDPAILRELTEMLVRHGYETAYIEDFTQVTSSIIAAQPSLVLLDLTLPEADGQLICREIRAASSVPIMILTSRATELDEVMSMSLGADDFVAKPYRSRVLLAHIEALLRRASGAAEYPVLSHGGVTLDIARSLVTGSEGQQVELTKNELRILALLMRRAGTIVSREDLMHDLWDSEAFVDDNTLTVNINRLRGTLERIGVHDYLITHRGRGYSVAS